MRVLSRWVKIRPWYYTERRQPTRAAEKRAALADQPTADDWAYVCRREDMDC